MTDFLEKENCIRNMNKQIHGKVLSSQEKKLMKPLTLMFLHMFVNKTQKAKSLKKESCPIEVEKNFNI